MNLWLSTTRSYFKNSGFEVTEIKLLNKDTCQQFKAHQEQDGGESYVFNFFATGRIVINAKMHRQEPLKTRIPALKNTKLNSKSKEPYRRLIHQMQMLRKIYRAVKPL